MKRILRPDWLAKRARIPTLVPLVRSRWLYIGLVLFGVFIYRDNDCLFFFFAPEKLAILFLLQEAKPSSDGKMIKLLTFELVSATRKILFP